MLSCVIGQAYLRCSTRPLGAHWRRSCNDAEGRPLPHAYMRHLSEPVALWRWSIPSYRLHFLQSAVAANLRQAVARRQTFLHPRRDEPLPTPVSRGDFCGFCARWADTNTPFCASPLLSIFDSHSSTSYDIKTRPISQEGSKAGARAED
jgi:hypothetical protein